MVAKAGVAAEVNGWDQKLLAITKWNECGEKACEYRGKVFIGLG